MLRELYYTKCLEESPLLKLKEELLLSNEKKKSKTKNANLARLVSTH